VLPDGRIQDQGFRIQAFKFLGGEVAGQIIAMAVTRTIFATLTLLAALSAAAANPQVEIKTTLGAVVIELYRDKAPLTVDNFLQYVKERHYDGTLFHRVIPGFMIQGGGYGPDFGEKPARKPVRNEAGNGLRNEIGTIAMARTSDPHSATAQFFINVADNEFLNFRFPTQEGYGYCVFGKVVKGMEVVNRIVKVRTGPGPGGHRNVPVEPVVIENARLLDATAKPAK
jgi:peptidyl-prolyl cis-trans isomerase A (cyclophilin A)/peptidyl-prolyl cis-trans isomerase B (cyclophilin B)